MPVTKFDYESSRPIGKKEPQSTDQSKSSSSSSKREVKFDTSNSSNYQQQQQEHFKPDQYQIGGKHTTGYESFVGKLFAIGEKRPTDPSGILNAYFPTSTLPNANLPASVQLKLEGFSSEHPDPYHDILTGSGSTLSKPGHLSPSSHLGTTSSLHDYSTSGLIKKSEYSHPMVSTMSGGGSVSTISDSSYRNRNPPMLGSDRTYYSHTYNPNKSDLKIYESYAPLPKKYRRRLVSNPDKNDMTNGHNSIPVTPYIFRDPEEFPNYRKMGQRGDTRIVGSNFVMYASRPDDLFFGKIERILDEARKTNSWNY